MESLKVLKNKVWGWPEPWKGHARELMRDAAFDLMQWPKHTPEICEDLRQSLQATEEAMLKGIMP